MAFTFVTSAHGRYGKTVAKGSGQAITKGQVLQWDLTSNAVVPSDNTSTISETQFIATESITSGAALTEVHTFKIDSNNQVIADTVNNSNIAHNGQRMILNATGLLANNTGTDAPAGVFRQTGVIGLPADRLIIGEFVSK